jgi:hypothetical protein
VVSTLKSHNQKKIISVSTGAVTWTAPIVGSGGMEWRLGDLVVRGEQTHVIIDFDNFAPASPTCVFGAEIG